MNIEEFLDAYEIACRQYRKHGVSPMTVIREAKKQGVDLGAVHRVGVRYLIPRGWTRMMSKSERGIYYPPEKSGDTV